MTHDEKHPALFLKLKDNLFADTKPNEKNSALDYLNFEGWIDRRLHAYSKTKVKLPSQ